MHHYECEGLCKDIWYLFISKNKWHKRKCWSKQKRKKHQTNESYIEVNNYKKTIEGKYSLESTDSRESEIRAPPQLTIALKLSYYLFIARSFIST